MGELIMTEAERVEWVNRVLRYLNYEKRRCTYGALAELIGVLPRRVAKSYLGKPRWCVSWVVNKETGRPKGFTCDQLADGVLNDPKDPIYSAAELRQLVSEFDDPKGGLCCEDDWSVDQQVPEADKSKGFITTHVLNTALGKPAKGLTITLYRLGKKESRIKLARKVTNADGRTDTPILPHGQLEVGQYELIFCAGDYLDALEQSPSQPRFLGDIPIRFGIADANSHYHVPLLLSPFGYSTYRGS